MWLIMLQYLILGYKVEKRSALKYELKSHINNNDPLKISLKKPALIPNLKKLTIKLPRIDFEPNYIRNVSNDKGNKDTLTEDQLLSILEDPPQEKSLPISSIVNAVVDKSCNSDNTKNDTSSNLGNTHQQPLEKNQYQEPVSSGVITLRNAESNELLQQSCHTSSTESIPMYSSLDAAHQPCQITEHSSKSTTLEAVTVRSNETDVTGKSPYSSALTTQNLVHHSGQTSKYIQENRSPTDGRGILHANLQIQNLQDISRESHEFYNDNAETIETQNFTHTIQNYQNATNPPMQTSESVYKTSPSTYNVPFLNQNPYKLRTPIRKPYEAPRGFSQISKRYDTQNSSNVQAFENIVHQKPLSYPHAQEVLPASNNYSIQDSHKLAMYDNTSNEASKVPHQPIKKNPQFMQSISNTGHHSCKSSQCSCEKHLSSALKQCLLQGQPLTKTKNDEKITRRNNSMISRGFPQSTQNTPPHRLQGNQFYQYHDSSVSSIPQANGNCFLQNPHPALVDGFLETNGNNQRVIPSQSVLQVPSGSHESSNGSYHASPSPSCSCKCSHDKPSPLITTGQYGRSQHAQETLVRQATNNHQDSLNIVNQSSESTLEQFNTMRVSYDGLPHVNDKIHTKTPINDNNVKQISRPEFVTENTAVQSSSEGILSKDFRAAVEQLMEEKFIEMFNEMNLLVAKRVEEATTREREIYLSYNKSLEEVIDKLSKFCNITNCDVSDATASTSKGLPAVAEESKIDTYRREKRKVKRTCRYTDDAYKRDFRLAEDEDDNREAIRKQRAMLCRPFILPPEYNRDNSEWTLRYHKAKPGLVEVLPTSRVYINALKFEEAKRIAKDYNTLARMLLIEIFTISALRVCSLTGSKAQAYYVRGAPVRPGLDSRGRIVMMTFVKQHGRERGWDNCDEQSVLNSIRSRMQAMRSKRRR